MRLNVLTEKKNKNQPKKTIIVSLDCISYSVMGEVKPSAGITTLFYYYCTTSADNRIEQFTITANSALHGAVTISLESPNFQLII